MKIKLKFRCSYASDGSEYTGIYALVSWPLLEPYWIKEDCTRQPDRSKLRGYQDQWFSGGLFDPPFIGWNADRRSVDFTNGRHRLALITKHQNDVPVILCGQSILQPEIHQAVIKILTPDDEVVLPDLPFVGSSGRIPVLKEGLKA